MKITLLIPCYNEELSIRKSIKSWLSQSRKADEIIIVDDSSTDKTPKILNRYKNKFKVVKTSQNLGSKSHAQEYGIQFATGEIVITTDGDTVLHKDFIKHIEKDFADPKVGAVAGEVKSLKYNWITACRALDYVIGHNIDKNAQNSIGYIFVIPGAAGAFRTALLKDEIGFDHDTITEDLDFTYKIHKLGYKIKFDKRAICYTQDPSSLKSYVNQMRRWYGGGWQNFIKHVRLPDKPSMAFELSLMYGEGLIFSTLLLLMPFINLVYALAFTGLYSLMFFLIAIFGVIKERRMEFLFILPAYIFLKYINSYVYLEQFFKEVIFKRKNLVWYKPERVQI